MVKGTSSGQGGAGNLQEGKGKDEERGAKLLEGINGSKVAEKARYLPPTAPQHRRGDDSGMDGYRKVAGNSLCCCFFFFF